jgi:hypothetical protein
MQVSNNSYLSSSPTAFLLVLVMHIPWFQELHGIHCWWEWRNLSGRRLLILISLVYSFVHRCVHWDPNNLINLTSTYDYPNQTKIVCSVQAAAKIMMKKRKVRSLAHLQVIGLPCSWLIKPVIDLCPKPPICYSFEPHASLNFFRSSCTSLIHNLL